RAAAQRSATSGLYDSRGGNDLLLGLYRARTTDYHDAVASDCDTVSKINNSVFRSPFARHLLVRLRDVNYLSDAGERLEAGGVDTTVVSDEADGSALRTRHRARLVAHVLNYGYDGIDVFRRRHVQHVDLPF